MSVSDPHIDFWVGKVPPWVPAVVTAGEKTFRPGLRLGERLWDYKLAIGSRLILIFLERKRI